MNLHYVQHEIILRSILLQFSSSKGGYFVSNRLKSASSSIPRGQRSTMIAALTAFGGAPQKGGGGFGL